MKYGAHAYVKSNVDTGVANASPHQLISMLFDGAIHCINRARYFLDQGDIVRKCEAISQACQIVDNGLSVSVDASVNPEFAGRLVYLYKYVVMRLMQANLRNDRERLAEALRILNGLRDAWANISPDRTRSGADVPVQLEATVDSLRKPAPVRRELSAYRI